MIPVPRDRWVWHKPQYRRCRVKKYYDPIINGRKNGVNCINLTSIKKLVAIHDFLDMLISLGIFDSMHILTSISYSGKFKYISYWCFIDVYKEK